MTYIMHICYFHPPFPSFFFYLKGKKKNKESIYHVSYYGVAKKKIEGLLIRYFKRRMILLCDLF